MVAIIGRECLIREPTKVTDVPNTLIFYMGTVLYKKWKVSDSSLIFSKTVSQL